MENNLFTQGLHPEIFITEDGTNSIRLAGTNESYHSVYGACNESSHIFIENGLKLLFPKPEIKILEIGWGTGLNSLLTMMAIENCNTSIHYTAIEAFPLPEHIYQELNYAILLGIDSPKFITQHQVAWGEFVQIQENFRLKKIHTKAEDYKYPSNYFDLVYFDAFAPSFQPELWTHSIFSKIYDSLKPEGLSITYCCKGDVKRTLKQLGFFIEKFPGPKGKREALRAWKNL